MHKHTQFSFKQHSFPELPKVWLGPTTHKLWRHLELDFLQAG